MVINQQLDENLFVLSVDRINAQKMRFSCLWNEGLMFLDIGPRYEDADGPFEMASFPVDDFNVLLERFGQEHKQQFLDWYQQALVNLPLLP